MNVGGKELGQELELVSLVNDELLALEIAARRLNMTLEEFENKFFKNIVVGQG